MNESLCDIPDVLTTGDEILEQFKSVVYDADQLILGLEYRINGVLTPSRGEEKAVDPASAPLAEKPPYFDKLRDVVHNLEHNNRKLAEVLDRIEL